MPLIRLSSLGFYLKFKAGRRVGRRSPLMKILVGQIVEGGGGVSLAQYHPQKFAL